MIRLLDTALLPMQESRLDCSLRAGVHSGIAAARTTNPLDLFRQRLGRSRGELGWRTRIGELAPRCSNLRRQQPGEASLPRENINDHQNKRQPVLCREVLSNSSAWELSTPMMCHPGTDALSTFDLNAHANPNPLFAFHLNEKAVAASVSSQSKNMRTGFIPEKCG